MGFFQNSPFGNLMKVEKVKEIGTSGCDVIGKFFGFVKQKVNFLLENG